MMNKSTQIALKLRFSNSYTNKQEMVHKLPNGLFVITLDPEFAHGVSFLELENIDVSSKVSKEDCLCKTDKGPIKSPISGTVVDINKDAGKNISMFRSGPTSSYLAMIKPEKGYEPLENDGFEKLF